MGLDQSAARHLHAAKAAGGAAIGYHDAAPPRAPPHTKICSQSAFKYALRLRPNTQPLVPSHSLSGKPYHEFSENSWVSPW